MEVLMPSCFRFVQVCHMGLTITDVDGGLGVHLLLHDSLNDQQFYDGLVRFFAQESFASYRYCLVQFTPDLKMNLSVRTVRAISNACLKASSVNPDVVLVFVAPKNLHYGLVRMWAAFSDGISWEVTVFRACQKAEVSLAERVTKKLQLDSISLKCS